MMLTHTPSSRTLFITGTTGFVGSHFLHRRDDPWERRILLVRGRSVGEARGRVAERLDVCARSLGEGRNEGALARSKFVCGDLTAPRCGVDDALLEEVGPIDDFWHFAASLDYRESKSAFIEGSNLTGTANAIELAVALRARRFIYVSTAYTVGARRGEVREELHPIDSEFNNEYERTKCMAEHEVARLCEEAQIEYHIVRPGIVIGPSTTKDPGGSNTGLYGLTLVIDRLRERLLNGSERLLIDADPDAPLHFIPVDAVVEDLLRLEQSNFQGGHLYHITAQGSVTTREALGAICRQVGVPAPEFRSLTDGSPRTALQRLFRRNAEFFLDYMKDPKTFVRSQPGEVAVTVSDVDLYVKNFLIAEKQSGVTAALSGRRSA